MSLEDTYYVNYYGKWVQVKDKPIGSDEYLMSTGDDFPARYYHYTRTPSTSTHWGYGYTVKELTYHEFHFLINKNAQHSMSLDQVKNSMDKVKEENNMEQQGWIRDLITKVAKEEVIKAIAQHEKTKVVLEDDNEYDFKIGQKVFKHKGDYNLEGTVVGYFKMTNGAVRYVIEHEAKPKGSFCHIYSSSQLQLIKE